VKPPWLTGNLWRTHIRTTWFCSLNVVRGRPTCNVNTMEVVIRVANRADLWQLLHGFLGVLVATVDHVDAKRHRVNDVLLHETSEARQVRRDAGNSHHRTFRCVISSSNNIAKHFVWSIYCNLQDMVLVYFTTTPIVGVTKHRTARTDRNIVIKLRRLLDGI